MAIKITLYNNYYTDEQVSKTELSNVSQALEVIDRILRGTELDVLITHNED